VLSGTEIIMPFLNNIGPLELLLILGLALLIFGRRLPEVGRSLGKGIVEFKRGLKGVSEEIETESDRPAPGRSSALPPEPAYRSPLPESGQDRRVSQGAARVEEVPQQDRSADRAS
jgi:TatA/E family protein of Tat protein translocase